MMLRVFVVSFFYDVLIQIAEVVEEPFGVDADDLNLDAILVQTERQVYFNLCQAPSDMPASLHQTWIDVKNIKEKGEGEEKKDKKAKSDKKEEDEDNEKDKKDKKAKEHNKYKG